MADAWYRQPVLWLGAAILAASLAGCVWTVVLGSRHADLPLDGARPHTLLDMPVHAADRGAAARAPRPATPHTVPEHMP
ncbi:hypothetical protein [Fulvimonas yonginensis]|uniref:Lipoprotein n=1 Tax=Fulvimonas yonginensis TaxID=1495200 RepID=A0ABU8JD46_9GAMM